MANEMVMVRPFHTKWDLPRCPRRSTALHDVERDVIVLAATLRFGSSIVGYRNGRKAARNSSEKRIGSSQAAKWPPLSTSLK